MRSAGGRCFTVSDISATITTRNDRPFSPKQAAAPKAAIVVLESSGPNTRARLNWIELSAIAFGRSFLWTSDGISDWYAGPPNACAKPVVNDSARMCQIWT